MQVPLSNKIRGSAMDLQQMHKLYSVACVNAGLGPKTYEQFLEDLKENEHLVMSRLEVYA